MNTDYIFAYTTFYCVKPCEVGECTPYYLCLNGSIITSGEGILDVRLGAEDDPMPGKCIFHHWICELASGVDRFLILEKPRTTSMPAIL